MINYSTKTPFWGKLKTAWQGWAKTVMVLLFVAVSAQVQAQLQVSGVVKDENGSALPGVNVLEKGTSNGTTTDASGQFSLAVNNSSSVLVFSFIGYLSEEMVVGNQTQISFTMVPDVTSLDEIVVVGYGSQKKSDLTGSVAVVNATDLKKVSSNDVGQLLQGRTTGVSVNSDGQPGAFPQVRIRGIGSISNNDPLYVIDGVPVVTVPREFNTNDVESIQVLKDASAGAIYGTRAMNGVIIITTKRGKRDSPVKVEYSGYFGIDKVWQKIPVTGTTDYQNLNNESSINGGRYLAPTNDPTSPYYVDADSIDTDWQDEGLKNGFRQNHNISLTGGSKYTNYGFSVDYFTQEGTFVGNGPTYDRYSVRVNTDTQKGIFKIGQSFYYAHSHENSLTYRDDLFLGGRPPLIGDMVTAIPTLPVYDPSRLGGYSGTETFKEDEIILNAIGVNNLIKNWIDVDRIFLNMYAGADVLKKNGHNLEYKFNVGLDRTITRDYSFVQPYDLGYFFPNPDARLSDGSRIYNTLLVENTLNYNTTIGKLKIEALAGQAFQEFTVVSRGAYTELNPEPPYYPVLSNGQTGTAVTGGEVESVLSSYFGRVNLSYEDRYLLTANVRRDGSSKFSETYRYGVFPSVSAAWKIHNESFITLPQVISELKLRGGYGVLGSDAIPDYTYMPSINTNIVYNWSGQRVIGASQTSLVSSSIKWEEKTTRNVGVDVVLADGKFEVTAEYYSNITEDVLTNSAPVPQSTGSFSYPWQNAVSIKNSGFELIGTYRKISGDFSFDVSANMTTLKNRVLALAGTQEQVFGAGAVTSVGSEIGQHFGWEVEGVFQDNTELANHATQEPGTSVGDLKFKDQLTVDTNGDGIPDAGDGVINQDDRVVLGSGLPSIYFGFNFNARYKNFDFTFFASGSGGYEINSRMYRDLMRSAGRLNYHEDALERWTPDNRSNVYPRLVYGDPNQNGRDSNREGWLQDGAHLRINTVSVGYTFPEKLIKGISSARVYVTGQNLYTFQKYKSFNPDFTSGVFNPGFDFGSYPKPRTIMLGVQVGF